MSFFQNLRLSAAANPVLLMLAGLMFLINPVGSSTLILSIAGVAVFLSGASDLLRYFTSGGYSGFVHGSLLTGLVKAVLGLFLFTRPGALLSLFSYVVAVFVLVSGISSLENAMELRRFGARGWLVNAIVAVLVLLYGVSILLRPFGAASAALSLVGLVMLAEGVMDLLAVNRMGRF